MFDILVAEMSEEGKLQKLRGAGGGGRGGGACKFISKLPIIHFDPSSETLVIKLGAFKNSIKLKNLIMKQ